MRRTVIQEQNRIHFGPGAVSAGAIRFPAPARPRDWKFRSSRRDFSTSLQAKAQSTDARLKAGATKSTLVRGER